MISGLNTNVLLRFIQLLTCFIIVIFDLTKTVSTTLETVIPTTTISASASASTSDFTDSSGSSKY